MYVLYKCGGDNSSYGIDRDSHEMLSNWKKERGFKIIGSFSTKAEAKAYAQKHGMDVQYGRDD